MSLGWFQLFSLKHRRSTMENKGCAWQQVIQVKSEIEAMLQTTERKQEPIVLTTPIADMMSTSQRCHPGPDLPCSSSSAHAHPKRVTTIQVKSSNGKQTYVVKLLYTDNVGALYECLRRHLTTDEKRPLHPFIIRSSFPPRSYENTEETLQQAGLVPSATLFIKLHS